MHIEYFVYFQHFAKTMSISQTAADFYMTPQGVSRAIHSLEKEFGTSLISRTKNSLTLTKAGSTLLEDAESLVDAYEQAHRRMANYTKQDKVFCDEVVTMYVTALVSAYLLPLMDLYSSRLFSFNLSIQESNIFKIIPKIRAEEKPNSFAFVSVPEIDYYESLLCDALACDDMRFIPLFRTPIQALVSVSSPLAHYKKLRVSDFKDSPIVMYNDPVLFDVLADYLGKQNIVMTTSSFVMLQQELEKNHAGTFVPAIAAAGGLPKATVLKPLADGYSSKIGFLASKTSFSSPLIGEVMDYLRTFFFENQNLSLFKNTFEKLVE